MDYTRIEKLREKLKSMRPLNPTELKRLREEFMVENTYDSNAIEGNTLTLRETAMIIKEGITIAEKPVREHLDAIGHKDAFEHMVYLADKNEPLTERAIKELHSLVLMADALNKGAYRRIPVTILGAAHIPPQPYLVPVQMEALIADYGGMKKNRHIIEAVAEFHLRFEGIHPFIDGNGRTGRIILNLELIKAGLLPINIKFRDKNKYYDSFDSYYADGRAPDRLAELISAYETDELLKHISILEQKI